MKKDRIGGKDTHWSSVFLYSTSSSTSLWHSPLSTPSHFPPFHTYAFETPSPRVASDFGGCCTSRFLACFSSLLCDLPSQKAPAKSIRLLLYLWAQVFLTAWTYRALYRRERVSKKWEEACLSKRWVMGPEGTSQLPWKPASLCFYTCQERCYINDRTFSMATFCMLKAFSQVGVYVNDFSQWFEVPGWWAASLETKEWLWPWPTSGKRSGFWLIEYALFFLPQHALKIALACPIKQHFNC